MILFRFLYLPQITTLTSKGITGWCDDTGLGVLLIWILEGQGPTALAVGMGGHFVPRLSFLSSFPSLSTEILS